MILDFDKNLREFLAACEEFGVRMLLVGGGAVNFHGYQRHSADLDFWIEVNEANLTKLKKALEAIGFVNVEFPQAVEKAEQNISLKISPVAEIELITRFSPGKSFAEAYIDSEESRNPEIKYRVISFSDLIESKRRSNRKKDQLDILELIRIKEGDHE